jgi:hypothetical protein
VAKRGPKPKLTQPAKKEILLALEVGLSLADTLLATGVSHRTFKRGCKDDAKFARGVKAAAAQGKLCCLKAIRLGVPNWQARAWFLERKYGAEYGQKVKVEHGGRVEVREEIIDDARPAAHETNGHQAAPGASRVSGL